MLFDYIGFKNEVLLKDPDSEDRARIEAYIEIYGDNALEDEPFYKEYLSHFEPIAYCIPEEYENYFDWQLLIRLIAGSFSSQYDFKYNEPEYTLPDLFITVQTDDQALTKTISELLDFQIMRLYEIYIKELINFCNLLQRDEKERRFIESERKVRIKNYANCIEKLKTELNFELEKKALEQRMKNLLGIT